MTCQCEKRKCVHFREVSEGIAYCEAFPDGIPAVIAFGQNKHKRPFLGDNGIQYEKSHE